MAYRIPAHLFLPKGHYCFIYQVYHHDISMGWVSEIDFHGVARSIKNTHGVPGQSKGAAVAMLSSISEARKRQMHLEIGAVAAK